MFLTVCGCFRLFVVVKKKTFEKSQKHIFCDYTYFQFTSDLCEYAWRQTTICYREAVDGIDIAQERMRGTILDLRVLVEYNNSGSLGGDWGGK